MWYNVDTVREKTKLKEGGGHMNVPNKTRSGERRSHNGVIACCDHCGFPIYSPDDAVIVEATDEIIHVGCWEEYSEEHMFDFVMKVSERVDYSDV